MNSVFIKTPSPNSSVQDAFFIILLTLLAATLYGIFHFSGFVTPDEVRYGLGFQELSPKELEPFNYEMSFGYYLTIKPLISLLPTTLIPVFLNGISSLAGTLILIPLYLLIKSLSNSRVAFGTGLFLVFSPSYWLLTRYGHPMPLSMIFFFSSMAVLNRSLDNDSTKKGMWVGLSILLSLCALIMRVDIFLYFLVPLGIVLYKEDRFQKVLPLLLSFYCLTLLGYLVLKWVALGYIVHPSGGTVAEHFHKRIPDFQIIFKSLIKNTTLFIIGFLPFLSICLFLSILKLFRIKQWRLLALIGLWTLPTALFLPFWAMDFSRLYVPILPPLLFIIVHWLEGFSSRRFKYVSLIILLIVSHATLALTTSILIKVYPFKTFYQNRPIAMVPIETIISDFFLRRDYLEKQGRLVRQVIQPTERNVVIISDGHHVPWYEYELLVNRQASCFSASLTPKDSDWLVCPTDQNIFYIGVIGWQSNLETVNSFIHIIEKNFADCLFHVNPFMLEMGQDDLFIEKNKLLSTLKNNPTFVNRFQEIFKTLARTKDQPTRKNNGQKN
jgi:hypothetical protein